MRLEDVPELQDGVGALFGHEHLPLPLDLIVGAPRQGLGDVGNLEEAVDDCDERPQSCAEPLLPLPSEHFGDQVVVPQLLHAGRPIVHQKGCRCKGHSNHRRQDGEIDEWGELSKIFAKQLRAKGEGDDALEQQKLHALQVEHGPLCANVAKKLLMHVLGRLSPRVLEDREGVDDRRGLPVLVLDIARWNDVVSHGATLFLSDDTRLEHRLDIAHLQEIPDGPNQNRALRQNVGNKQPRLRPPFPQHSLSKNLVGDGDGGQWHKGRDELQRLDAHDLLQVFGGVLLQVLIEPKVIIQLHPLRNSALQEPLPERVELRKPHFLGAEELVQAEAPHDGRIRHDEAPHVVILHAPALWVVRVVDPLPPGLVLCEAQQHDRAPERLVPSPEAQVDDREQHAEGGEEGDCDAEEPLVDALELLEEQLGLPEEERRVVGQQALLPPELQPADQHRHEAERRELAHDPPDDGQLGLGDVVLDVVHGALEGLRKE
mmetsp:Transcript_2804/g.6886  ORF Transcript_2804/g.6886 Transcript_2804/m.6886 type:complete len:487 (-) Transcript_2804:43-1503(-)